MASSTKLISILFLFTLFSMQIHGREFFSKIPSTNNNEKETTTITKEQEHETTIPETTQKTYVKEEQEPRFVPETRNGYGLYGHESGQLPPSTTTTTKETYEPYVTPVRYHPDEPYNSIPESSNNNKNTFYYNKNAHEGTEQKDLGEARFTERGWSTKEYRNNNNYYNSNNRYNNGEEQNLGEAKFTERGWSTKENQNNYYNGNNGYYNNVEKQGMSDTRFLENGKYFHDIKSENNYYPKQFENSRASRNEYNGRNTYNSNGRYNQNQEEFEESEEEEFEP
ncbi:hypothetical protein PTKIN_Ptkin18bG0119900 [Pterospermum kingtungense]